MEKIYKKTVCVDIGSTNSQIAQRIQASENEKKTWKNADDLSKEEDYLIKSAGNDPNFPTAVILSEDLSDKQKTTFLEPGQDYVFGADAINIHQSYCNVNDIFPLHVEFKRDLFYSELEKEYDEIKAARYEKAIQYVSIVLKALKKIEAAHCKYICDPNLEITYITVPVRATASQKDLMKKLATEAGWLNVEIVDETDGILYYALNKSETVKKNVGQLTIYQKLNLLIVDIGGSTNDILLVGIGPDGKGGHVTERKAIWPKVGESDTLGGIDIDKAIYNWLMKNECLIPSLAEEDLQWSGYRHFRIFKEATSDALRKLGKIDMLVGDVSQLQVDFSKGKMANRIYANLNDEEKITVHTYTKEIFREYALKLQKAVRDVLEEANVKEEELDGIILTGGGSQMYGVEELFRGTLNIEDNPFNFTKIRKYPDSLVVMKENASGLCALGNVIDKANIPYKKHSLYNYSMMLEIFKAKTGEFNGWYKIHYSRPGIPDSFQRVVCKTYPNIISYGTPLEPSCKIQRDEKITVKLKNDEQIMYIVTIYGEKNGTKEFQFAFSDFGIRTPIRMIKGIKDAVKKRFSGTDGEYESRDGNILIQGSMNSNSSISLRVQLHVDGLMAFSSNERSANG